MACPRVNFPGEERRLEHEDEHLPPSSIQVKNENYTSTFPYTCVAYRGQLYLTCLSCIPCLVIMYVDNVLSTTATICLRLLCHMLIEKFSVTVTINVRDTNTV